MKREFLQNFKVGDQPLPKEVIDAIMAVERPSKNGVSFNRELDITDPNKSFEELLADKMKRKGLSREEAIKDILNTATKTRQSINEQLFKRGE